MNKTAERAPKREERKNVVFWEGEKSYPFLYEREQIRLGDKPFLFSLVMAMHDSVPYLDEAVRSVLAQSIGFEKCVQLILVDDGSTDDTFSLSERYADAYPDNVILIKKQNGGVSSARNVGLRFATGKYLNFLDSDDKFSENALESVARFFSAHEEKTDVVAIKTELFGAKQGDTWFNAKFRKGTRLIDLWKEPQIYLNSTNCTFFHKRILNQLHFDERLSIAEDLKVVNLALMNKWTLGVVAESTYFYRIRAQEEGSLVGKAKSKEYWYLPYLQRVFFELTEIATKRCGFFPDFLQYTLFRDLFNRFDENVECASVLHSEEERAAYKTALFKALSLVEDRIILRNTFLNSDEQIYFLSAKHGAPAAIREGDKVRLSWNGGKATLRKTLYARWERADARGEELLLEGYVVTNNLRLPFSDFRLSCDCGENECSLTEIAGTTDDKLAFLDEKIFSRRYFTLRVKVKSRKASSIRLFLEWGERRFPVAMMGYGKWFALSGEYDGEYFEKNRIFLWEEKGRLLTCKGSIFTLLSHEIKMLRVLKSAGEEGRKALLRRLYYRLSRLLPRRKLWLLSDRNLAAGDNGQAFYEFLCKKPSVNAYFAIDGGTEDFRKLKKRGFRLLDTKSRRYRLKFLTANAVISSHFDGAELRPIRTEGVRDLIAKKHFVFLQHGITKDDLSRFYSRKKQNLDLFITAATKEYRSILKTSDYFCDESIVKLTGFPRYDKLRDEKERVILVMPTWRKDLFGVDARRFLASNYFRFYHALLSDPTLRETMARYGYRAIYFSHFNLSAFDEHMKDIPGLEVPAPNERDYARAFALADLLVTDYSSAAFDFAYLRKPVVYCQGDKSDFYAHHTYASGYFDYERDGFGEVTYDLPSAVEAITRMIRNGCEPDPRYLERVNAFFPFHDRENCRRVYDEIIKLSKRR